MMKNYFKSIEEWKDSAGFKENWQQREFLPNPDAPGGVSDSPAGISRRDFLKVMAGGLALLGLTGCRRPVSHIVPSTEQPENRVVGRPQFYATSLSGESEGVPLIVETHEGRPTKLEGNERFAPTGGATSAQTQAAILDLYDPDRGTKHVNAGRVITKAEAAGALDALAKKLAAEGGAGTVVVAHPTNAPGLLEAKRRFLEKYPKAKWVEYSAFDRAHFEAMTREVFGLPLRARWRMDRAERVLALDCDFLGAEPGAVEDARAFTQKRRPNAAAEAKAMNRLYVAEPTLTLTGAQADHRLRLADRELVNFAARLWAALEKKSGATAEREAAQAEISEKAEEWLKPMAADLWEHRGRAVVVCGGHQGLALQALVYLINERLGAWGKTAELLELPATREDDWAALEGAKRVILFGGNPAFDGPEGMAWEKVAARADVVRWGYRTDETTQTLPKGSLQLLAAHELESWGLGASFEGTLLAQQPMVEPLFDGMEALEFWARLGGEAETAPRAIAEKLYAARTGKAGERAFNDFLNYGFEKGSGYAKVAAPKFPAGAFATLRERMTLAGEEAKAEGLELLLRPSATIGTGAQANNAWLQECPDPISKLTWGNALFVSAKTAAAIGYHPQSDSALPVSAQPLSTLDRGRERAPIVTLEVEGRTVKVPLAIQPGMADDTALLNLGYGHRKFGRNAEGFGVDAYPFVKGRGIYNVAGANIRLTGETELLASTQNHWSIEGRNHYREGTREEFLKDERFAQKIGEEGPNPLGAAAAMPLAERVKEAPRGNSAYEPPKFTAAQQWGLSIDLSACTGCNACVIACQSENNIPSVGKEQILRGREMQWIRIDRYYSAGDKQRNDVIPDEVDVAFQPMTCQHCERAPCEQVCPVNATTHDEQGLNVMTYNRCVGTRYCANNCPYKVRRFNFFEYAKREREHYYWGMFGPEGMPEILKLQKNPDVTIRSRGVMEKCTLCVQRIEQAKIRQRDLAKDSANVKVADGIIRTACQQVCPTGAIVFGDVADAKTKVSALKNSPRDYSALGYLNTRPRLTYLARLKNPNHAMPEAGSRFREEQEMKEGKHV